MNKLYAYVGALTTLVACGPGVSGSSTGAAPLNHVPHVVAQSVETAAPSPNDEVQLQVALPLRDEAALDAFLEAALDPQNPNFGQTLTHDEFAARFLPTDNDVAAVRNRLAGAGMTVEPTHNGTILHVTTTVANAEDFFQTTLQGFTAPDGRSFVAPVANLTLPDDLPIQAVRGLTYGLTPRSHLVRTPTPHQAAPATSGSGAFSPSDIHAMYNVPPTLTGKGQVLGLVEFDGYNASDIQGYENQYGLPTAKLTNVLLDGVTGAIQNGNGGAEVTLDIEYEQAMAPQIDQIVVFEGTTDIDILNEIANPTQGEPTVGVISCSWGNAENQVSVASLESDNTVFKQMVAQGQTYYDASGDSGAFGDMTNQTLAVDEFAGQPYVVGVGGTTLHVTGTNTYASETTWWDGQGDGSGGGISSHWPIPSWQANLLSASSKGSSTMRNVPDVSLNADPVTGYAFFYQGTLQDGIGGTSCAAPLWAGFTALLNEQRASNGLKAVGFMAPLLYTTATTASTKSAFHDIADNSNNGFYPAVAGLDDATGWGSLNGTLLLNALGGGTVATGATGGTSTGSTTGTAGTTGSTGSSGSGTASQNSGNGSSGQFGLATNANSGASCSSLGPDGSVLAMLALLALLPARRRRA